MQAFQLPFHCKMLTSLFLLWSLSPFCYAVLTDSLTIGNAKALSLGHAITADPPGLDSIHYNPAGLAQLKDRQVHYKLIAGTFDIRLKFGGLLVVNLNSLINGFNQLSSLNGLTS